MEEFSGHCGQAFGGNLATIAITFNPIAIVTVRISKTQINSINNRLTKTKNLDPKMHPDPNPRSPPLDRNPSSHNPDP